MHSRRSTILAAALAGALVLAGTAAAGAGNPGDQAEAAFRDARDYTVRIRTRIEHPFMEDEEGAFTGAGFLVDSTRGWIVTNAHVVGHGPAEIQVAFWGEPFRPARKIYVDSFSDVAILAVTLKRPRRAAALDPATRPTVGEPVGAYGHPLDIPYTATRGIVSGYTDQFGPGLLQIDATVDHGNSGGPVIALSSGRILGIATLKYGRLNMATPIEDVCRILDLLLAGDAVSPPRMGFALLKDEDDRYTLRVARSLDAARWPFEPGDRIVGLAGHADSLRNLSDLVRVLRGRTDAVTLTVERRDRRMTVTAHPSLRPLVLDRYGVLIDGALIAPVDFEDAAGLGDAIRLCVHFVESASAAMSLGIQGGDILHSLDGRRFDNLESLMAYLKRRPKSKPIDIVLKRIGDTGTSMFDYLARTLPDEDVRTVGPVDTQVATSRLSSRK
jgi:S1-C subfamily serine protease